MGFLGPALLAAMIGVAAPVLFHLLLRPEPRTVPFGPVELIARAHARARRRLRVKDALLLAVRIALVAVVVVAVARPYRRQVAAGLGGLPGAESVVVVLDDSVSLALNGGRPFERAASAAGGALAALGRGDSAAVVLAGRPARIASALTGDLGAARAAVDAASVSNRATDLRGVFGHVERILGSVRTGRRVVVVTDLQRTSWPASLQPPRGMSIDVIDVGEQAENLGIVAVDTEPAPAMGTGFTRVVARIRNDAPRQRSVTVELRIAGRGIAEASARVAAHGVSQVVFHHRFVPGGPQAAEVAVPPDALPADDVRPFLVSSRPSIRVLVVNGDPRPATREDEVFYLVRALAPGGDSDFTPVVVDAAGLAQTRLSDFDAVFLCNVASLPHEVGAGIESWIRGGGGVLLSAGDRVRPAAWNSSFAAILPARVRAIAPGAASLRPPGSDHPLLEPFADAPSGLVAASVSRRLALEEDRDLDADTLLRLSTGEPLLVERRLDEGRVLLWTSTIDRDWTDLPLRSAYLPLVQQAARTLAGRSGRRGGAAHAVGDEIQLPVPAGTTRVVLHGPGRRRMAVVPEGRVARFPDATEPGVYRAFTEGPAGGLREDPALAFVIAVDPTESDLRRWRRAPISSVSAPSARQRSERRVPVWPALLAALVPLTIAEAALRSRSWRR